MNLYYNQLLTTASTLQFICFIYISAFYDRILLNILYILLNVVLYFMLTVKM